MNPWPYRLLAPGPVPVPKAVMNTMSERVLHHRTPAFEKILLESWKGLQYVFKTAQPVQILTGTGTSAMEAAVVNTCSPGDEALVVVSGKFGERWAEICARYGIKTRVLKVEWGHSVALETLAAELKGKNFRAVFSQVCETSTATLHPVQHMAALIRRECPEVLFVVDAITAVGCLPLPMDEWDLDVVIAGSQKAFMIPTGLSFIAMSERAWAAQSKAKCPKFYLDLALEKKANARKETHFSTPTPLIAGLNAVLARIQEAGLDQVIQRCELLAGATRTFGERLGMTVYSQSPSSSVTALRVADGVDSGGVRDWLERERNITVMGGQEQLKGKILRVGHMGDVRDDDMTALFASLAEKLGRDFDARELEQRLSAVPVLFP
jgi:aspartate aminotransferase-like enzyme